MYKLALLLKLPTGENYLSMKLGKFMLLKIIYSFYYKMEYVYCQ
jgi:hypothetical protein